MNKLIIPAGIIALALCGSLQVEAGDTPSQTNIPSQIIARATGVTGNQQAAPGAGILTWRYPDAQSADRDQDKRTNSSDGVRRVRK